MLAEMDEEFGVGELVRETIKEEKNMVTTNLFTCVLVWQL